MQPDDDLAFERIYNTPRRGLGESALRTLRIIQRAHKVSLFEATRRALETDELKGRQRKSLGDLIQNFDRWRAMLDGMNHVEVVETHARRVRATPTCCAPTARPRPRAGWRT